MFNYQYYFYYYCINRFRGKLLFKRKFDYRFFYSKELSIKSFVIKKFRLKHFSLK